MTQLDLMPPPFGPGSMVCGGCGCFVQQEWRDDHERAVLPAHGDCPEVDQFKMADVRRRVDELQSKGRKKRPK